MNYLDLIRDILSQILKRGDLSLSVDTISSDVPGWDSLANINLIVLLEKSLSIRFTSHELSSLANVGDLVDLCQSKHSSVIK